MTNRVGVVDQGRRNGVCTRKVRREIRDELSLPKTACHKSLYESTVSSFEIRNSILPVGFFDLTKLFRLVDEVHAYAAFEALIDFSVCP